VTFLPVSLATLERDVPTGAGWIHEAKLDGYRIEAVVDHRAKSPVTLYSRNAHDWTARFPAVVDALARLPVEQATLDGEIVVPVALGQSAFQALQRSLEAGALRNVHYVLFDLLLLDDADLRRVSLRDRLSLLRALLQHREPRSPLRPVRRYSPRGGDLLARACADGLEGLVCKKLDGRYESGRHRGWVKVKCIRRQEFVVVGYTEPRGSRTGFGALLLAVHDATGALHFAGKVGTGFDTRGLAALYARLRAIERPAPTLARSTGIPAREVHWVEPSLVAEVAFTEWTDDGRLRHPVFQGLREDKLARDVVREHDSVTMDA
jgi:bifunctional non-homologous end joining protein LigD